MGWETTEAIARLTLAAMGVGLVYLRRRRNHEPDPVRQEDPQPAVQVTREQAPRRERVQPERRAMPVRGGAGPAVSPGESTGTRVVDDRVFLLGLDRLYRQTMREHECGELSSCASRVAEALRVEPADVPVEGYYGEDERLTEYFLLLRGLQEVRNDALPRVEPLAEFRRLREVVPVSPRGRSTV